MVSKAELHQLVDSLPDEPTEDDILYALYIRRSVELGIEDWKAGRSITLDELRRSSVDKWQQSTGP